LDLQWRIVGFRLLDDGYEFVDRRWPEDLLWLCLTFWAQFTNGPGTLFPVPGARLQGIKPPFFGAGGRDLQAY
jgi:hypothetical protein